MNPNEIWQVDVNGTIYETSLDELKQWIAEGAVLRQDKIRRGNLRWLEAGKVPFLLETFNSSVNGGMPQVQTNVTEFNQNETSVADNSTSANLHATSVNSNETNVNLQATSVNIHEIGVKNDFGQNNSFQNTPNYSSNSSNNFHNANPNVNNQGFCFVHPEEESKYVCETCLNEFCRACPKNYGSVSICPICGAMCKSKTEQQKQVAKQRDYRQAITEGFGFGDFTQALAYPFKYPVALVIGGLIYGLLSIAQGALGMGSYFVAAGGIICMIFANALTFGCLANTINEFSQGKFDTNFMSFFDDFDIWEAVLKPFFITIGVYLVTFGLLIAIVLGGIYFTLKSISSADPNVPNFSFNQSPMPMPNQVQNPNQSQANVKVFSPELQNGIDKLKQKDIEQKRKIAELMGKEDTMPPEEFEKEMQKAQPTQDDIAQHENLEEKQFQELEKFIQDSHKKQLESTIGESPETKKAKQAAMIKSLVSYGLGFLALAGIALLWAIFYYPAACLVAGYTQSFAAVLNPLVGLDTIKRLGGTYVKILLMSFLLSILASIPMGLISTILAPFDMPTIGNVPAIFLNSIIYFYFFIVFSAILGFAVYKNADKLAINQY